MNKKNKWDIIGADLWKVENLSIYWDTWYWYDYDDDYCYRTNCTCDNCSPYYDDYSYVDYPISDYKIITKTHLRSYIDKPNQSLKMIDMNSIYPKEVLRQRKIDYLLGVGSYDYVSKPTFGDILKNRNINENRDI